MNLLSRTWKWQCIQREKRGKWRKSRNSYGMRSR